MTTAENIGNFPGFKPLMTIQITPKTTPEIIRQAHEANVIAGKVYPLWVTTNSDNGVSNYGGLFPVFEEMQRLDMVLSLHGETPDQDIPGLEKEVVFLDTLKFIIRQFPRLRIVLEHITTREAVKCIIALPDTVAATITAHHLVLTLDDVIGYSRNSRGLMQPHNFCKPIAKSIYDHAALCEVATKGNPKFFFGSDSAPHPKASKECAFCCAGVFNAPVALPLLAQVFESLGCLGKLQGFVSDFGARFYRLVPNEGTLRLVKKEWQVPDCCGSVVPFMAGQKISWQVAT